MAWITLLALLSTTPFSGKRSGTVLSRVGREIPGLSREGRSVLGLDQERVNKGIRKFGHVVVYGILGFLLYRALCLSMPSRRAFILAVLCGLAVASADEIHQWMVPERTGTIRDFRYDLPGLILGAALASRLEHRRVVEG